MCGQAFNNVTNLGKADAAHRERNFEISRSSRCGAMHKMERTQLEFGTCYLLCAGVHVVDKDLLQMEGLFLLAAGNIKNHIKTSKEARLNILVLVGELSGK